MEEFSAGTQCEVIAQRDLFGMIEAHLLESQVVEADRRLADDESGLWTVAQYAGWQPDGGKGAGGATLIAHLASEQNAADGAETLVVRDGSSGGVGEIRRRSGLRPAAGQLHQSARVLGLRGIRDLNVIGEVCVGVTPLQNGARRGRRAQDPFPVVRLRRRIRLTPQSIE